MREDLTERFQRLARVGVSTCPDRTRFAATYPPDAGDAPWTRYIDDVFSVATAAAENFRRENNGRTFVIEPKEKP